MKNAMSITVAAIVFALISLTATYSAAQDVTVPNKKELATLLKTAKQPSDHLRIAAYYAQRAARLRNDAKEHTDMAANHALTNRFTNMESKHGYAWGQSAGHCQRLAQSALDEARKADALAALHTDMANTSIQK